MDNGCASGNLVDKFAGLAVGEGSSHNDGGLMQVMKAVEAAEITIKHQADENTRLRNELLKKVQEIDKYEQDRARHMDSSLGNQAIEERSNGFLSDDVILPNVRPDFGDPATPSYPSSLYESNKINGVFTPLLANQAPADIAQSSPSTSFPPNRYQIDGDCDQHPISSSTELMPMSESNSSLLKQDLSIKVHEHEKEIILLRKRLADYSVKDAQLCNEKSVLEKRISYMRMAFDQQQQDLVDAATKALSYRQDIIEENIHLTYVLQDAQQERSIFISSLVPLLAEYSLHPQVHDAQSIVSNVKVLFKHLHEKLIITEEKLKESKYHLAPWHSDVTSNSALQSPSNHVELVLAPGSNRLELVPRSAYSSRNMLNTPVPQTMGEWEALGPHQSSQDSKDTKHLDPDDLVKYSSHSSRNIGSQDLPMQFNVNQRDSHPAHFSNQIATKQVKFSVPVGGSDMDNVDGGGPKNEIDSAKRSSKKSPYTNSYNEPSSSYPPYLPPVLEDQSASLSEVGDDDPLPAIEGLQISGEVFPGRELQASGFSTNGTTSCNFEWVRHLEDGSVIYIDGAKQPNYLVTADDMDTYLAIEVQPLDDRKRKGELVKLFANDHTKITCEPLMQQHIEKTLNAAGASYKVSLSTVYLDIWEPVTFTIKKDGYSIKSSGSGSVFVTDKFSSINSVVVPYEYPTEFSLISSNGVERVLRADSNSSDISCSRDTIVLTLRLFIMKANEKKKGKKRSLFFKS